MQRNSICPYNSTETSQDQDSGLLSCHLKKKNVDVCTISLNSFYLLIPSVYLMYNLCCFIYAENNSVLLISDLSNNQCLTTNDSDSTSHTEPGLMNTGKEIFVKKLKDGITKERIWVSTPEFAYVLV